MILSQTVVNVKSGEPFQVDIACGPHEQLYDYSVSRVVVVDGEEVEEGLGMPTARIRMSMLGLRQNPLPVSSLYGPLPFTKANRTVSMGISTVGWGKHVPNGQTAHYRIKYRSASCLTSSQWDGVSFSFPATGNETLETLALDVYVSNEPLLSDTEVAELPSNSAILVVDYLSGNVVEQVEPGCTYVIVVNVKHLAALLGQNLLEYTSALEVRYFFNNVNNNIKNGVGVDLGGLIGLDPQWWSEKELTLVLRYLLYPRLIADYFTAGAGDNSIWGDAPFDSNPLIGSTILEEGALPSLGTLLGTVDELLVQKGGLVVPFHIPYTLPTVDSTGSIEFSLRASSAQLSAFTKTVQVVDDSEKVGFPQSIEQRSYTASVVFMGVYENEQDPEFQTFVAEKLPGIGETLKQQLEMLSEGAFTLDVVDACAVDINTLVHPKDVDGDPITDVDGNPISFEQWFQQLQSSAVGQPGFSPWPVSPTDLDNPSDFRRLAVLSYSKLHKDDFAPSSLLSKAAIQPDAPNSIVIWDEFPEVQHTIFFVKGFWTSFGKWQAYAPSGGLCVVPGYLGAADYPGVTQKDQNDNVVCFNYFQDMPTYGWDPSSSYLQRGTAMHEFSHGSFGRHGGGWFAQLGDYAGHLLLPFGKEPCVLSRYGLVRAVNNIVNYRGKTWNSPDLDFMQEAHFGLGQYDVLFCAAMGPHIGTVKLKEFSWPPDGGLSFEVTLDTWSTYRLQSVNVQVLLDGLVAWQKKLVLGWPGPQPFQWQGGFDVALPGFEWLDSGQKKYLSVRAGVEGQDAAGTSVWSWDENEIELSVLQGLLA